MGRCALPAAIAGLTASPHARATVAYHEANAAVFIADDHRLRDITARVLPLVAAAGTDAERHAVERIAAGAAWRLGDVAGAHRRLDDIARASPPLRLGDRNLTGIVVDGRGDPVAGATVAYGPTTLGDAYALALAYGYGLAVGTTTTDAAGRYVIANGPDGGVVIAQRGDQRSLPVELASANRLVLAPTTTVRGHLDRAGRARDAVIIARLDDPGAAQHYVASAPVAADGSFELAGMMRGHWHIGPLVDLPGFHGRVELEPIVIGARPIEDLALTLAPGRDVTVIVRSTSASTLDGARDRRARSANPAHYGRAQRGSYRSATRARIPTRVRSQDHRPRSRSSCGTATWSRH